MPDKRDRFIALAERRVTRAIKVLRLIGNLANRNNYAYTEQDATRIVAVLEAELKLLRNRFSSDTRASPGFKL
jgi:hypothetical protein